MTTRIHQNLHITIVTRRAPSANYRGQSEDNRAPLQSLTVDGQRRIVVSPDAVRARLRDKLGEVDPELKINRVRLHGEDQLAVRFADVPNAALYADDFAMGYLITDAAVARKAGVPPKRVSPFQCNYAVALDVATEESTMHQSPQIHGPFQNSANSALLQRDVQHTAFQMPMTLVGSVFAEGLGPRVARALLLGLADLDGVAGNHAHTRFDFDPVSVVARLTRRATRGFAQYPFAADGSCPEVTERLARSPSDGGLPPAEMWLGGELARAYEPAASAFRSAGGKLYPSVDEFFAALARAFAGSAT